MKTSNGQYSIILEAKEVQPDADLYALAAPFGTYIGNVVSLNTPYPSVGGVVPFIFTPSNELHLIKAAIPIDVTVSGISINDVNEGQSLNIPAGNSAGLYVDGISTVNNDVQPSKIEPSIISIELGIVMCLREIHPANTTFSSFLILGINVTLSRLVQLLKAP